MVASRVRPGSVLVVDDDPIMRELLTALLEAEGLSVTTTASGPDALALLSETADPPDVVLTDLRMPGMDAAHLMDKLRALRAPGTLLLGMSGSEATAEELHRLDGFLRKPFSTEDFNVAVERAAHLRTHLQPTATSEAANAVSKEASKDAAGEGTPVLDETTYRRLAASLPPAQLRELYRITIEDVLQRVETMRAAAGLGDHETCRREAHALKGGCGMVGATELRVLATTIEAGSPANTPTLEEFAAACTRLHDVLSALLW